MAEKNFNTQQNSTSSNASAAVSNNRSCSVSFSHVTNEFYKLPSQFGSIVVWPSGKLQMAYNALFFCLGERDQKG